MTLKKMLLSACAVLVSSTAFAFTLPPDDVDPFARLMEQHAAQEEELYKKFDEKILPPLKELLQIAQEFGNSTQEALTPEQESAWNMYQATLTKALMDMATPIVEQTNIQQMNDMFKQIVAASGQPAHEFTKQEFTDMMAGMIAISALVHFQETKKLTAEEVELAMLLFFPQTEEAEQE